MVKTPDASAAEPVDHAPTVADLVATGAELPLVLSVDHAVSRGAVILSVEHWKYSRRIFVNLKNVRFAASQDALASVGFVAAWRRAWRAVVWSLGKNDPVMCKTCGRARGAMLASRLGYLCPPCFRKGRHGFWK